ncbi:MAG TPA: glycoside hydrolase family 30 beta sandwich domain-containing protein [Terriglobales bacterium]|nr:glycoside hydrolase family 30 beta sandwich domain-containing protein [Terriglobales bacterium]
MNRRLSLFLLYALLIFPFISSIFSQAQAPRDVQFWLTTADRSALLALQPSPLHFSESSDSNLTVDVNDMAQYQSMDGFGVALTGGSAQLLMRMDPAKRSVLLKELFETQGNSIAISYLRLSIGSSDMNEHVYSYDDLPAGQTDVDQAKFNLGPDRADVIPVLKEILAINPRIKILGSPWSAPAWMKTNDNPKGGHLKPEYYGAYAAYLVKYVQAMKAEGVTIDTITVENEPLNPKNTPSMAVFAPEEGRFIAKNLGPAFEKANIHTKILLYDHNPDVTSYPLSILADPEASKYVDGTAFHLYGGEPDALTKVHDEYPNKNLYLTEQSIDGSREGPLAIAESVRRVPIAAVRNWGRNVLLWNLAADPNAGPHTNDGGCTGCIGAITLDGNNASRNVAYYTLAHFSRFVPPGSVRIDSNEQEQLATAAFRTPDGRTVLVVSNTANFEKTFNVRYHSRSFSTTLPPESAATYLW